MSRLLCAAAALALSACAGQEGNMCIQEGFFPGDKIKVLATGAIATVKVRYGPSSRCSVSTHPILADVTFN